MDDSKLKECATLDRVLVWGEIPATDTAVERAERARERDLQRRSEGEGE